jgi:hypothetical protein
MRFPISDLPEGTDIVTAGKIATVTMGEVVFKAEASGDVLLLYPERSVKQRDFLKLMGRIVD